MQVKVSARHGQLPDATQKLFREKAEKLLHYFERLTMIEITVDAQNHEKLVGFRVSAEHKHDFVAHERHAELLTAFDMALAEIERQLRRYKEKLQDHRRDPSAGDGAAPPA